MGGKGHFKEGTQGKIVGRNAESDGVMVEYVDENGNKSSTCVGARHIPEDKRESALAAADKAKHAKEEPRPVINDIFSGTPEVAAEPAVENTEVAEVELG